MLARRFDFGFPFFSGSFFDEFFNLEFPKVDDSSKEKSKDYTKREHEVVSKNEKYKTVTIEEQWTDEDGCIHKSVSTKTVPNVSEEELIREKTIKALKQDIQDAVNKEDYDLAAKKKKELDKLLK